MTAFIQPRTFHCPEVATKRLKLKRRANGRTSLVISSNLLCLFGFEPGSLTVEEKCDDVGFKITPVQDLFSGPLTPKKVYSRSYKGRKNNPIEALVEVTRKELLEDFSDPATQAHVIFRHGQITVRPLTCQAKARIDRFLQANRAYTALVGCTSGVDVKSLENNGFQIDTVIEWRPHEARDTRDLTETGVVSVLRNSPVGAVVNEDIMALDLDQLVGEVIRPDSTLLLCSPVCSDFSNSKRKAVKERAFEDGTSTLDMAYDIMRMVEKLQPAVVGIEQVPGFYSSDIYRALSLRMRRWGYRDNSGVYDAKDFGGLTGRKRFYGLFTSLPAKFELQPTGRARSKVWDVVMRYLDGCRDVTHSKAVQDGARMGLLRKLTPESEVCPTITRSQSRMAKDTLVVEHEGRYLHPSEELLAALQALPEGFELDAVGKEQAVEIIGQSVDGGLHEAFVAAVKSHIGESEELLRAGSAKAA